MSLPDFLPNFPSISIPFSKNNHPICTKLGAFYDNLPKIHPIYVIWSPSSLMKTLIAIPKFAKKRPKGRHIYVYHVNEKSYGSTREYFLLGHILHKIFKGNNTKVSSKGCKKNMRSIIKSQKANLSNPIKPILRTSSTNRKTTVRNEETEQEAGFVQNA